MAQCKSGYQGNHVFERQVNEMGARDAVLPAVCMAQESLGPGSPGLLHQELPL